MKYDDIEKVIAELHQDAKMVADMTENWIVNMLANSGKNLAAIREGLDHIVRHNEIMDDTLNMSPNKAVEAIWTSYDWDQVLEISDMLLARLCSRDERAA